MSRLDSFFLVVGREVSRELNKLDAEAVNVQHWVVMEDSIGVEVSPIEDGEPSEILSSLVGKGAYAAAYVTYVPDQSEHVLAYVLVTEPRDSDVRRCPVVRSEGTVALGPWERTV